MQTLFNKLFFIRPARAVEAKVCNYNNNYYGDQQCVRVSGKLR